MQKSLDAFKSIMQKCKETEFNGVLEFYSTNTKLLKSFNETIATEVLTRYTLSDFLILCEKMPKTLDRFAVIYFTTALQITESKLLESFKWFFQNPKSIMPELQAFEGILDNNVFVFQYPEVTEYLELMAELRSSAKSGTAFREMVRTYHTSFNKRPSTLSRRI